MESNSSADGPSINNMKTYSNSPNLYFYVVKATFKNCIFSRQISVDFVFLSFDNCSFYESITMVALSNLFGLSYNIPHVFLIRCTVHISQFHDSIFMRIYVESQIHIVQSRLIGADFDVEIQVDVAHLTIHDCIINDTNINMMAPASTAVGIVQITNTILTQTVVGSVDIKPDTPINVYTRFCLNTAKSKFSLVSLVADW